MVSSENISNFVSGYRSGFGNAYFVDKREKSVKEGSYLSALTQTAWKTGRTAYKANTILSSLNAMVTPYRGTSFKGGFIIASITLISINIIGVINVRSNINDHAYLVNDSKDLGFCAKAWESTPSLLVITNVALTALEFIICPGKAIVTFTCMGIAYCHKSGILPKAASKVIDYTPIPFAALACYFAKSHVMRAVIAVELVSRLVSKL